MIILIILTGRYRGASDSSTIPVLIVTQRSKRSFIRAIPCTYRSQNSSTLIICIFRDTYP